MTARGPRADVEKLYQLPLDEFTAARNALAREAGADGAEIRRLPKPPLAAWAVNQLYWKDRDTYDALIDASNELRAAHRAVLGGRAGDLRSASKGHDEALDRALKATLQLLNDGGQATTDATKQAILNTLRALPSSDPPGRLGRTLQPGGFEMLAGLPLAGGKRVPMPAARPAPSPKPPPAREKKPTREERAAAAARKAAAREALAEAAREAREAETELRRREFAAARSVKEVEKAARRIDEAREALAAAQRELEHAEREAADAAKARDRADRDVDEAQKVADATRAKLEAAQEAAAEAE